ncbi:hypothetical protein ACEWY4_006116 [Coilia grayii]|uniref:Uncharacterized protein n=1 Tax=Coilia grayii TaxID=363190 RepID=A0ABD1KCT7_9TELE
MERQVLLKEVKKWNNGKIIREKMAKTFALRRQEIVEKQPRVEELQERWPAMFQADEINAEFLRITTVPLQPRFLAGLDKQSSQLLQVMRKKGGAVGEKIRDILKPLDQGVDMNIRREGILKSLVIYLGEDVRHLIKEYLVVQKEEAEAELENATMAIFVLRDGDDLSPPKDIGLVIDGVEVLNNLFSIASACAMLFGLTYAVNLSYPVELKYTFETFNLSYPVELKYTFETFNLSYPVELKYPFETFNLSYPVELKYPFETFNLSYPVELKYPFETFNLSYPVELKYTFETFNLSYPVELRYTFETFNLSYPVELRYTFETFNLSYPVELRYTFETFNLSHVVLKPTRRLSDAGRCGEEVHGIRQVRLRNREVISRSIRCQ